MSLFIGDQMRKALYLMGVLSNEDLDWFSTAGRVVHLGNKDTLVDQGSNLDSVFILMQGQLEVFYVYHGQDHRVALLQPGEIVGEISFVDSRPSTASVRASMPSIVLSLPHALLQKKMVRDPPFATRFYKAICLFLTDRLRGLVGKFGYGEDLPVEMDDELAMPLMDIVSEGHIRFDQLLRSVGIPQL